MERKIVGCCAVGFGSMEYTNYNKRKEYMNCNECEEYKNCNECKEYKICNERKEYKICNDKEDKIKRANIATKMKHDSFEPRAAFVRN